MANLGEIRRLLMERNDASTVAQALIAVVDDVITLSSRVMAHRDLLAETPNRVDQLAAQLAGLQRLVETLVNERGEGRRPCCAGEPHTCDQEAIAAAEGRTDRAIVEISHLRAEVEWLRNELVNAPAWAAYDALTAEVRRLSDVDAMAGRLKAIVGPLWSEAYCVEVAKGLVGR